MIIDKIRLGFLFLLSLSIIGRADAAHVDPHDRVILAKKLAAGQSHVTMLIAVGDGTQTEFANFAKNRGATIRYRDDRLGYFRLRVPVTATMDIAAHPAVEGVNLSEGRPTIGASAPQEGVRLASSKSKGRSRLNVREYIKSGQDLAALTGVDEMGVISLKKESPTFDGRGVTVAVVEQMPYFEAPEFATAKTIEGKSVPKFAGAYATLIDDPEISDDARKMLGIDDRSVVRLSIPIRATKSKIFTNGRNIHVPDNGFYQVAFLDEQKFSDQGSDLNKDGNPQDKPRTFAIAKKMGAECLLVDLNQNDDLNDDSCLADYNSLSRTHYFLPPEPGKKGSPFVVLKSDDPNVWVIAIPSSHSHLASLVVAGDRFFGTVLSSPAPAARLLPIHVSIFYREAVLEGIIRAARQPQVDVILSEVISNQRFNHRGTVSAIILDRIVRRLNKVIIAGAGNAGASGRLGLESASPNVIAAGQFYAGRTLDILVGGVGNKNAIPIWSSPGPTEDGRLKPDIIAPSLGVLPLSGGFDSAAVEAATTRELCPNITPEAAFTCFSGTSMAGPSATGAIAVLISAAKQLQIPFTAQDIYRAVTMSARYIPGIAIHRQGNGVVNVPNALEWLRRNAEKARPQLAITAPVNTALSRFLPVANQGEGLYEEDGWEPGSKAIRYLRIRRESGPKNPVTLKIKLIGNEQETFSVPRSVTLPLMVETDIPLIIAPRSSGRHSAALQIEMEGEPLARVSLNVIAAPPLSKENGYTVTIMGEVGPNIQEPIFFKVPPDVIAVSVSMDNVKPGFGPLLYPLTGIPVFNWESMGEQQVGRLPPDYEPASVSKLSVYYPTGGVWALETRALLQSHEKSYQFKAEVTAVTQDMLRNILQGGLLRPSVESNNGATAEAFYSRNVAGRILSGRIKIGPGELPRVLDLNVPDSVKRLDVKAKIIVPGASRSRIISLMVLNCRVERCYMRGIATGNTQAGLFAYKPGPGQWRLAIDVASRDDQVTVIEYEVFSSVDDEAGECVREKGSTLDNGDNDIDGVQCYTELVSNDLRYLTFKNGISTKRGSDSGVHGRRLYEGEKGFFMIDDDQIIPLTRSLFRGN